MESSLLGLVLDSSTVISAERNKQPIPDFIETILNQHGPLDLSLSPVTALNSPMESIGLKRQPQESAAVDTSRN